METAHGASDAARRIEAAVLLANGRSDLAQRLLASIPTNDPEDVDRAAATNSPAVSRTSTGRRASVRGDPKRRDEELHALIRFVQAGVDRPYRGLSRGRRRA